MQNLQLDTEAISLLGQIKEKTNGSDLELIKEALSDYLWVLTQDINEAEEALGNFNASSEKALSLDEFLSRARA